MNNKLIYTPKKSLDIALSAILNGISIFLVISLFLIAIFMSSHVYYNVKGTSMEPNILQASTNYAGDACYVEKGSKFSYGDIIVAEKDRTKDVVKRVIAMGGDKVGYYFNTETGFYEVLLIKKDLEPKILDENYLFEKVNESQKALMQANNEYSYNKFITHITSLEDYNFNGQIVKVFNVPENQLFLLGDNRATSIDSSEYGAVPEKNVIGKVVLITKQGTFPVWDMIAQSINKILGI